MKYFGNNKNVNFRLLEESGIYSQELVKQLKIRNYEYITETIDLNFRENENFMEPLLYAVKNEHGTYTLFKQFGENLQQSDLDLAIEIVVYEPEIIEDTAVSENKQFMLELAEVNPKVIKYMAPELKRNGEFIRQLCELNDKEVTGYVLKECDVSKVIEQNPELASNREFMKEAIKENAAAIGLVSEELRNDYEFIKDACKENKEVITHIAENAENFGKKGLTAAKESLAEDTSCRAIDEMKAELEKAKAEREAMESQPDFSPDDEKYIEITNKERKWEHHINLIEDIKSGKVNQERAVRLLNVLGKRLPEGYKEDLAKYLKLDDAILAKEKQEKEEKKVDVEKDERSADGIKVEPQDIERASSGVRTSDINKTTREIREEYTLETKEEKEVGDSDRGTNVEERT